MIYLFSRHIAKYLSVGGTSLGSLYCMKHIPSTICDINGGRLGAHPSMPPQMHLGEKLGYNSFFFQVVH